MIDEPHHHLDPAVADDLIRQTGLTPRTARVAVSKVLAVARYLLEWSTRGADAGRYCDSTVDQIAEATMIANGTVRKALAIITTAGGLAVVTPGGHVARRGSVRRLYLTTGTSARAQARGDDDQARGDDGELSTSARAQARGDDDLSARAQARGDDDLTPRVNGTSARATAPSARAQARDSVLYLSKEKTRVRETAGDDLDDAGAPPPLSDTIRRIRELTGSNGTELMDRILAESYSTNLDRQRRLRADRADRAEAEAEAARSESPEP